MKRRNANGVASSNTRVFGGFVIVMGMLAGTVLATPSWSAGFKSPEECLAYSGDAHLNCLYAYIEIQQGKISKLQRETKRTAEYDARTSGAAQTAGLAGTSVREKDPGPERPKGWTSIPIDQALWGFLLPVWKSLLL